MAKKDSKHEHSQNHNFENEGEFHRKMTSRHLFMLSLGGVIGTGLFLSSGYTIAQAFPVRAVPLCRAPLFYTSFPPLAWSQSA